MTLRVVQIGAGGAGMRRAAAVLTDVRCVLVAICDPSLDARQAARERFADVAVYADTATALRCEKLDLAVVSTPHDTHDAQARAALAAGLHVICEKPLGVGSAAGQNLADLAGARGRVLAVTCNHLELPSVRAALRWLAGEGVGAVERIDVVVGHDRLAALPAWRLQAATTGGGALHDNGPHGIAVALAVWGDSVALRCSDAASTVIAPWAADIDTTAQFMSPTGEAFGLRASWRLDSAYRFDIDVRTRGGTLTVRGPENAAWQRDGGVSEPLAMPDDHGVFSWQADTVRCIDEVCAGASMPPSLRRALRISELLDQARRADHATHHPMDTLC